MRPILSALALAALLAPAGPPAAADGIPLTLAVGETKAIGSAVRQAICDDGNVVEVVDTGSGPAFRGRNAGSTVCSFQDGTGVRQIYQITVLASPADAPSDEPPKPSPKGA